MLYLLLTLCLSEKQNISVMWTPLLIALLRVLLSPALNASGLIPLQSGLLLALELLATRRATLWSTRANLSGIWRIHCGPSAGELVEIRANGHPVPLRATAAQFANQVIRCHLRGLSGGAVCDTPCSINVSSCSVDGQEQLGAIILWARASTGVHARGTSVQTRCHCHLGLPDACLQIIGPA